MIERLLGKLLRPMRGHDQWLFWNARPVRTATASIHVTSPAFADNEPMPRRYAGTGVGDNISPPLAWANAPANTAEFALVVEDPDAPLPRPIVHAIVTGIPSTMNAVREGALNPPGESGIRIGNGSFGRLGYHGPRPVSGHGPHRYIFQLVALSQPLGLSGKPDLATLLKALDGHMLARGRLIGTYERS